MYNIVRITMLYKINLIHYIKLECIQIAKQQLKYVKVYQCSSKVLRINNKDTYTKMLTFVFVILSHICVNSCPNISEYWEGEYLAGIIFVPTPLRGCTYCVHFTMASSLVSPASILFLISTNVATFSENVKNRTSHYW